MFFHIYIGRSMSILLIEVLVEGGKYRLEVDIDSIPIIVTQLWIFNKLNSAVATELEKFSFHSNPKERQPKNVQTTTQLHSSHMLVK